MAGETSGPRGEVQVWSPERCAIWRRICGIGAGIVALVTVEVIILSRFHNHAFFFINWITIPGAMLGAAVAALRRPCYITTDDEGIGVTTAKSSRALRWDEIRIFEYTTTGEYWHLKLSSDEKLKLNVTGYSVEKRESLRSLIEVRADLYPDLWQKGRFVRRLHALPSGSRNR